MQRFDVHAHAVPAPTGEAGRAAERALVRREGFTGSVPGAGWTVQSALAFMDGQGTALQLLSVPGALGTEQARTSNERTAEIVAAHPHRFGLLAALPMGQPDQALAEIGHALDELDADGFVVATNYDGAYLGDQRFEPVLAELGRRGAPLFVHPALPPCFDALGLGRPGPLLEYPMDMARTVVDALFAGVLLRHPDLPIVLAHAGGVLPTLRDRIAALGTEPWTSNPLGLSADQITAQLAGLYLDTAIAGGRASIVPAVEMVGADHLVFGTDHPPAGIATITASLAALSSTLAAAEIDPDQLETTFGSLFPRAAARASGPV